MADYIKLVKSLEELTAFKASDDFVTPNITAIFGDTIVDYNPIYDYSQDYLTFVAKEDGTFKFGGNSINYSLDNGETWTTLESDIDSPTVQAGNKIMFKAELSPEFTQNYGNSIGTFISTGKFIAQGNVMSLLYGDEFIGHTSLSENGYVFMNLFNECIGLINAGSLVLPATTLEYNCYEGMFYNCSSLTTAPELPATTLVNNCYHYMFYGCSSLTTAPELPATRLADYCYEYMFNGCTSLTTAPELPATRLADHCYSNMFNGCTSLTTAPELPATTLTTNCYEYMFNGCSSLTTSPSVLSAISLSESCYYYMFSGCTSLTTAPVLPATTLANYCYEYMFNGCTSLTTAPELPATTLAEGCYKDMFNGCISLTTAPELPATTLAEYCYSSMFSGCTNLNNITCLATDILATDCTAGWMFDVASSGTFVKANSMTDWTTGDSGIPEGWTIQDAA